MTINKVILKNEFSCLNQYFNKTQEDDFRNYRNDDGFDKSCSKFSFYSRRRRWYPPSCAPGTSETVAVSDDFITNFHKTPGDDVRTIRPGYKIILWPLPMSYIYSATPKAVTKLSSFPLLFTELYILYWWHTLNFSKCIDHIWSQNL